MTQYIDKDAVVAKIKKLIRENELYLSENVSDTVRFSKTGAYSVLNDLLHFLDTIEVKDSYEECIQYPSIKDGIKAHAETYSFNIESELFNQLTKEQQELWRKEIEQACINGGDAGVGLARDIRYKENFQVKETKEGPVSKDLEEAISQSFIYHENHGDDFRSDKQIETAYRCGFETCAKYYKELISITEDIEKQTPEVKEVDLEKEIKDYFDNQPIITRSKGIDYQLIPSGEDIAKHFFELGLKA